MESLGRDFPDYARSFDFAGAFIDDAHRALAERPVEGGLIRDVVPGFLRPADALALYEQAFFAPGDVLEMGSAWGLSTSILCRASRNSGRRARVTSIEISADFHEATRQAVAPFEDVYDGILGDAGIEADLLISQGRTFGFAFIDHDHSFEATRRACEQLQSLLRPGGYALFHDFNDERNRTEPLTYGVYLGVRELVNTPDFDFIKMIGCCALVRRSLS